MQPQPLISAGVANVMGAGAGVGPHKVSLPLLLHCYRFFFFKNWLMVLSSSFLIELELIKS